MNMIGDGIRNRRRAPRASVLLPASVVTMSAYQYLEVVDLSPTGAKLRGSPRPDIGKTAMFRLEGIRECCARSCGPRTIYAACGSRSHFAAGAGQLPRAGTSVKLDMLGAGRPAAGQ